MLGQLRRDAIAIRNADTEADCTVGITLENLAAMLAAQGYQVEIRPLNRIFEYVVARQEGCRLVATALQDDGYYRDRFEAAFARFGPTRYYYRSNHGGGYPRVTPILEDHLQRWSFRFGIVAPRPAVIAVAASSACRVQTTPWASLRIWPIAQTASPGE